MSGGCAFAWQSDGFGWVPPGAGVSEILATDPTIEVLNGTGPVASIRTVYGPPWAPPVTRATDLVTSTAPGAVGDVPPYAGSQTYLSLGTPGSPIALEPGTYSAFINLFVLVSAQNTEYWLDVFLNGVPTELGPTNIIPAAQPVGSAGGTTIITAITTLTFPTLTNVWIDMQVAKAGGPGSVTYKRGEILLYRTGEA